MEPARTEEITRGSSLELSFRGSGWVFLGETGGRDGIRYDSRRFDGSSAVFHFTADRTGEYQLRFQRQDPLSGEPENLVVRVTVRDPPSTAAIPNVATAPPLAGAVASISPATGVAGAAAPAPVLELPSTPAELLRLAREELAALRI
ncbi:MAG TPA: hypothetical protein VLH39_00430, partial [Magnetospirillaceae bacterium]|nr:hypothetical protein [Magnetospirillaceae bacterium]